MSRVVLPLIIMPSSGTLSYGLTSMILPISTLMAVAVIAAFCLGDFVEAAMVTILFSIGEIFEDRAVVSSILSFRMFFAPLINTL